MTAASPPMYDVVSIGFGPASLAIAIALVERSASSSSIAQDPKVFSSLGGLQEALRGDAAHASDEGVGIDTAHHAGQRTMSACFIEENTEFDWHKEMLLPGARMQISFLKDLATLRNPSSSYTFLSYLHSLSPSRLVSFISLGQFSPMRREYSSYMKWCARKVAREMEDGSFAYGERVVSVEAVLPPTTTEGTRTAPNGVKLLMVTSRRSSDRAIVVRFAKNLIISTGGSPKIPEVLKLKSAMAESAGRLTRVIHTSRYLEAIGPALEEITSVERIRSLDRPLRIAVIGAGQSSSEVFLALRSSLSTILHASSALTTAMVHRSRVDLYIRRSTLRPADSSEFSNEVFDPGMSQAVYGLENDAREMMMKEAKGTNYSVVNPRTLSEIYATMYAQKVEEDLASDPSDPTSPSSLLLDPKLSIHPYSHLTAARLSSITTSMNYPASLQSGSTDAIVLTFRNPARPTDTDKEVEYDLVVCGTGYERSSWKELLFPDSTTLCEKGTFAKEQETVTSLTKLFGQPPSYPNMASTSFSSASSSPSSLSATAVSSGASSSSFSRAHSASPSPDSQHSSRFLNSPTLTPYSPSPSSTYGSSSEPSKFSKDTASAFSSVAASNSEDEQPSKTENNYAVAANYRLMLPRMVCFDGVKASLKSASSEASVSSVENVPFQPTIWLQGCNEASHGISDSLLSVLAVRAGELVDSLAREGSLL